MPEARDPEYFAQWHTALVALAVEPDVVCKISSLGMNDPHRTTASRRPRPAMSAYACPRWRPATR